MIVEWNEITERTLVENGQPIFHSMLYYGFTALAMYDAVVTIEGGYEPWSELPERTPTPRRRWRRQLPRTRCSIHYFPNSAAALTADYEAALAEIPNGVGKVHGIRVGEDAAAALIARHPDDGINAPCRSRRTTRSLPGEWRPTPPATARWSAAWLGFMDPLVLPSPTRSQLAGPPALNSAEYAADFAEVRDYGGASRRLRAAHPEQTATALFHTVAPRFQHLEAIRDQITGRGLDIVDAARALAVFDASLADAAIACWRAKYDFKFWRPVTAIALADTDGNPATEVVPGWAPLRPTPPYPDYPAATPASPGRSPGRSTTCSAPGRSTGPTRCRPTSTVFPTAPTPPPTPSTPRR